MYMDSLALFGESINIAAADPTVSTNVLDLSVAQRRLGTGMALYIVSSVDTTFIGASATAVVELEQATTAGGSYSKIQEVGIHPALAAAGTVVSAHIDLSVVTQQFIRLNYDHVGGTITTGVVTAFITDVVQLDRQYDDNRTITEGAT